MPDAYDQSQSKSGQDNGTAVGGTREEGMIGSIDDLRVSPSQLFFQSTEQTRMAQCISDPRQDDCPIVYANQAFLDLTGYDREEVIGHNCRFLQGPDTSEDSVSKLRDAIETEEYRVVDILNYRKDGTPFWNAVHVGPIYDENDELAYFFGSQWDVTELLRSRETIIKNEQVTKELRHRTDNLFGVLNAIVRLSARSATDVSDLSEIIQKRIEALAGAHRVSLSDEGLHQDKTSLPVLAEAVMRPYRDSHSDRIELSGDLVELPREYVTPFGLTMHELATNAVKYGALSAHDGKVSVEWQVAADRMLELHWVEQMGETSSEPSSNADGGGSGSGTRLIEGVIRGLGGNVDTQFNPQGLRTTIRVPAPDHDLI